jgi:hypothetical protein
MSLDRESVPVGLSRRRMLAQAANGFGLLALTGLLADRRQVAGAEGSTLNPLAVKPPHHPQRAKRVIFLLMDGGPSHVDLFDPKPRLTQDHGKPLPFEKPKLSRTTTENLMACPFPFKKCGRSGLEVSTLLPHLGAFADRLCIVRSVVADNINHANACLQMLTGEQVFSRPSLGSWLLYGLGSENQNLPGFIVVRPGGRDAAMWGASFVPAAYQGTPIADLQHPIANLANPRLASNQQRLQLDAVRQLNDLHRHTREDDSRLEARIAAFELAFRMQTQAPEAFDLSAEPPAVRRLYGIGEQPTDSFGQQCLLARRLVERGVRFIQLFSPGWDHHTGIKTLLPRNCASMDRPVAGLLKDLEVRGLLEDTLVIWGGEFGRTPVAQKGDGRDHHPFGFTMWLAGGGVKGGMAYGATDPFGWHAVENRVHVHDLHATILHLMGLDHERLTYGYNGRDYRLTDVYGTVVRGILA